MLSFGINDAFWGTLQILHQLDVDLSFFNKMSPDTIRRNHYDIFSSPK